MVMTSWNTVFIANQIHINKLNLQALMLMPIVMWNMIPQVEA